MTEGRDPWQSRQQDVGSGLSRRNSEAPSGALLLLGDDDLGGRRTPLPRPLRERVGVRGDEIDAGSDVPGVIWSGPQLHDLPSADVEQVSLLLPRQQAHGYPLPR